MRTAILMVMFLASGQVVQAQATGWPNTRRGWWIGAGVGDGAARFDCVFFCDSGRRNALSGYIRSGFTLSPHLLVGGEATVWSTSGDLVHQSIWSASFVALWYPSRTGAWYLKLGMGGMWYGSGADGVADITTVSADAPSVTLGAGYELRGSRNVSLVPWVQVLASPTVPLTYHLGFIDYEPPSPPDIRINVVQVGLGVTLH